MPSVPHVRGDEPASGNRSMTPCCVFPTCVGMNRLSMPKLNTWFSVPHVRGDEPAHLILCFRAESCSPRAWG